MNQQMGNGTWHAMYSVADRQKVVHILTATLKEIQSNNYNDQKAAAMATEFEKYTFMKSQSRDEYLRIIKQKITQLRNGIRNQNQQGQLQSQPSQPSQGPMPGAGGPQQMPQQMPQNPPPQGMGPNIPGNVPGQNANNNFLQQQAQARQQSAAQIQANRMRNPSTDQGSNTPQQQLQQISNIVRNSTIPNALLAKIPNLPPNVTTWNQVFDCINKKMIPPSAMPTIKEIHNTHLQVALRQHQQRKLGQMPPGSQGQPNGNQQQPNTQQNAPVNQPQPNRQMNVGMNNMGMNNMGMNMNNNVNINNMTPQQKQQWLQRQLQQKQQQQNPPQNPPQNQPPAPQGPQNPHPQGPQGNQQRQFSMNQTNQNSQDNQAKPPNFNITAQDVSQYSVDAMVLLRRLQANGSIQNNLGQAQQESFIRKYIIHQKTMQWKQQTGQTQQGPNQTQPQGSKQNGMNGSINQSPMGINQQQQAQIQAQQAQAQQQAQVHIQQRRMQQQQQQQSQGQRPQQMPPQQSPMMNNMPMNQSPMLKQNQVNLTSPMMNQRQPMGQQNNMAAQPNSQGPSQPPSQGNGMNMNMNNMNRPQSIGQGQGPNNNSLASMLPPLTEEMKVKLRSLIEEVSKNHVSLKDVSSLLSHHDKNMVRDTMIKISQQYANVDSIISYFFILTKNVEGTKRLIQMKYMTKNIMESLQRGSFLASPDLAEKLRVQYLKYFDYVKEQFNIRRQQLQNQNQNGAPQQQFGQPQRPASQQPPAQQQPLQPQPQHVQPPVQMSPQQFKAQPATMGQPPMGQQFNQMNIGQPNQWPNVAPPQPVMNSPSMNPNSSPAMGIASAPTAGNGPSSTGPASTGPASTGPAGAARGAKGKRASASGQAGRRKSNKANNVPTPSANATTPASLANAIKTPNSIPTPQVPQSQSSKNTPTAEQSPNYQNKVIGGKLNENAIGDIFSGNTDRDGVEDSELNKRRELSNQDPEKFFFAALANLLELDNPADIKGLPTPSPSLNGNSTVSSIKTMGLSESSQFGAYPGSSSNGNIKSPLSPPGEWTASIRPEAIITAFKQVSSIKESLSLDILDACSKTNSKATSVINDTPSQNGNDPTMAVKREREEDDDLDLLFDDKKFKPDLDAGDKYSFLYDDKIDFDQWKSLIMSNEA